MALVTGAASGLGFATARVMAREGAALMLGGVDEAGLEHTVREIKAVGGRPAALRCDITREEDNAALAAAERERFGALHIAHLNAGGGPSTTVLDLDMAKFDANLALNLRAPSSAWPLRRMPSPGWRARNRV